MFAESEGKTNPIKRAIKLLNDMLTQLEKGASKEAKCMTKPTKKDKVKAIAT